MPTKYPPPRGTLLQTRCSRASCVSSLDSPCVTGPAAVMRPLLRTTVPTHHDLVQYISRQPPSWPKRRGTKKKFDNLRICVVLARKEHGFESNHANTTVQCDVQAASCRWPHLSKMVLLPCETVNKLHPDPWIQLLTSAIRPIRLPSSCGAGPQ